MRPLSRLVVNIVRSSRRWRIRLRYGSRVTWGADFIVGPRFELGRGRTFRVGRRVTIGPDFKCMTHLHAGDDVMISGSVALIGNDHAFDDRSSTIQTQGRLPYAKIRFDGDNLVGFGTLICGNVHIGHRTIVGAGSLVTRDLPPAMVCVGRPAKPVRPRFDHATTSENAGSGTPVNRDRQG